MVEAVERSGEPVEGAVRLEHAGDQIRYEQVTLKSNRGEKLIENLSLTIPRGRKTLVTGANEAACAALFRATAGVATGGSGLIVLPASVTVSFLPERPYVPRSSLEEALGEDRRTESGFESEATAVLKALGIEEVVARAGGWAVEQDWTSFLSLPEQQLLTVARAVLSGSNALFFDRPDSILGGDRFTRMMDRLTRMGVTVVSNRAPTAAPDDYYAVLECSGRGQWSWTPNRTGEARPQI